MKTPNFLIIFLSSLRFFPCAACLMRSEIVHSSEHIDVHEQEIIGDIEQFVLLACACHEPASGGSQVEQRLECQNDDIKCTCPHQDERNVEWYHGQQGKRGDGPAQYAVGYELEGDNGIAEGVEHTA